MSHISGYIYIDRAAIYWNATSSIRYIEIITVHAECCISIKLNNSIAGYKNCWCFLTLVLEINDREVNKIGFSGNLRNLFSKN